VPNAERICRQRVTLDHQHFVRVKNYTYFHMTSAQLFCRALSFVRSSYDRDSAEDWTCTDPHWKRKDTSIVSWHLCSNKIPPCAEVSLWQLFLLVTCLTLSYTVKPLSIIPTSVVFPPLFFTSSGQKICPYEQCIIMSDALFPKVYCFYHTDHSGFFILTHSILGMILIEEKNSESNMCL